MKRKTKPAKDPLAGFKCDYPTPWRARKLSDYESLDSPYFYKVVDALHDTVCECFSRTLARAICRMGNGK